MEDDTFRSSSLECLYDILLCHQHHQSLHVPNGDFHEYTKHNISALVMEIGGEKRSMVQKISCKHEQMNTRALALRCQSTY